MAENTTDQYISLLCSLPNPEGLFHAKIAPLSRLKLEKRLQVLTPQHKTQLSLVEDILDWRQMHAGINQSEIIFRGKKTLASIQNTTLKNLIQQRLEVRTLILAMRMREQGLEAPAQKDWGFGRWQKHIVRHWNEPDFGLSNTFTWALKAHSLIQLKQPFKLEQLLLNTTYKQLQRYSTMHIFDFEAVVVYVLKWNIINRTVKYNSHEAAQRFKRLLQEALVKEKLDV